MDIVTHPGILRIVRFLISGSTAAVVNLGTLYLATEYIGLWYIFSACIAFVLSFIVSFSLQKYWTFGDRAHGLIPKQAAIYLGIALTNLGLDAFFLYLLVEYGGLHYIGAQLIVMGTIAVASFFAYRHFVFTPVASERMAFWDEFRIILPPRHLLSLLIGAVVFTLIPLIYVSSQIGGMPQVPVGPYNDADTYFERVREIADGHPLIGNPFFIEHRDNPPPAFFVADWLSAIPLLMGFPFMAVVHINLFGWTLLFLFCAYGLLRALELHGRVAVVGAILMYMSVYFYVMRPVSMQVVYPFFLLFMFSFVLYLRNSNDRRYQIFFAISSALAALVYTYAWQIIVSAFLVLGVAILLLSRERIRGFLTSAATFAFLTAPFVFFSVKQVSHPLYFETMERVGLIRSRLPITTAFTDAIVPLLLGLSAFFLKPRTMRLFAWLKDPAIMFFATTGIAITGVMFSNIVTGMDLELPQHIDRFFPLWFVAFALYLLSALYTRIRTADSTIARATLACVVLVMVGGFIQYAKEYGIVAVFFPYEVEYMKSVQEVRAPLQWLSDNVSEESVVWADPEGIVNSYLLIFTPHYALFRAGGALNLMPDAEVADRYLTAHYFALSKQQLIDSYHAYAGTGNAIHKHKTHNRKVQLCRLLGFDECGELKDRVSYVGEAYFDGLFEQYEKEIRPNITEKLSEYGVTYIVADNERDTKTFKPGTLQGTKKVYDDGRFTIYHYGAN